MSNLYKTEGQAIKALKNGDNFAYSKFDNLRDNKNVVITAIELNNKNTPFPPLSDTSDSIKDNKSIVLLSVRKDGGSILYASDRLKNDKEVVLEAIKEDGRNLVYASDELKNDKDIVLTAVKQHGIALRHASNELKNDKEVVLEARKHDSQHIEYASKELQELCKNKDPVMAIKTEIAKEYADKLQNELVQKQEIKQKQKFKI